MAMPNPRIEIRPSSLVGSAGPPEAVAAFTAHLVHDPEPEQSLGSFASVESAVTELSARYPEFRARGAIALVE